MNSGDTARAARWNAAHVILDNPWAVTELLRQLRAAGAGDAAVTLATQAAAHVSLENPWDVAGLLRELGGAGAADTAAALATRAAARVSLVNPRDIAALLEGLHAAGAGARGERVSTGLGASLWPLESAGLGELGSGARELGGLWRHGAARPRRVAGSWAVHSMTRRRAGPAGMIFSDLPRIPIRAPATTIMDPARGYAPLLPCRPSPRCAGRRTPSGRGDQARSPLVAARLSEVCGRAGQVRCSSARLVSTRARCSR